MPEHRRVEVVGRPVYSREKRRQLELADDDLESRAPELRLHHLLQRRLAAADRQQLEAHAPRREAPRAGATLRRRSRPPEDSRAHPAERGRVAGVPKP